ncbi:MAG: BTAD domain-containing putative transcriptional regulator [Candidatus Binatia bacterium]
MGLLTLRLFGGFEARLSTGPPLILPTKKAQGLLAYLALKPGQPHPRDKVTALLWGDKEEEQARHSLRQAISAIRKTLSHASPRWLVLEGDTMALAPAAVEVDVVLFERFVSDGSPSALEQATALYRGDFLEGLDVKEEMFEEWLMAERERLRELALDASAKLLAHQLKNNLDEAAIQAALRLLGLDPLQEGVHQILMGLYVKNGRRGAALMQYQRCVEILQRELGVEPEPETKQLYQDILQRSSRTPPAAIPRIHQTGRRRRKSTTARLELHAPETPLIGRRPEHLRLREAMGEARKGRGQTIAILGEAGIGKSRLLQELSGEAMRGGGLALVGHSYEIEQVLPFGPWINALRDRKVIEDPEIVQSLSAVWRVELARLFPEVGAPGLEVSTAPENAVRLFEAVAHLLDCLVSRQPLLLILEDLHWADEMSLRLFSFLSHRIQDRSVLLVGTAREEEVSQTPLLSQLLQELDRNRRVVSFTLSPLSRADTGNLVRRLRQARVEESLLTRLEQGVWASSEGNPFIVVETMRALQEGDGLQVQGSVPLPKRVRAVVAQRLERLSKRAKQLVAVAAVIGRESDFAVLERASGLGEAETAEGVEELVRRRVLHGVEERFDFNHDRIREVAYDQLLLPQRRRLHAQVARALEGVYAQNLESHYAALGVHYCAGEVWKKAVTYLRQAGTQAVTRSANREATQYFQQALEALKHLPENRQTIEQAIAIRVDLGPALITTKGYHTPEVERIYTQARELCERFGEPRRLFPAPWGLWLLNQSRGQHETAQTLGERLLAVADRERDSSLRLQAHHALWATLFTMGELAGAEKHLQRGLALYNPEQHCSQAFMYGGHDTRVCCRGHRAWTLWMLGYPGQALESAQAAVKLARELSHPFSITHAYFYAAWTYCHRGERQDAAHHAKAALELASDQGFLFFFAYASAILGRLAVEEGHVEEGIAQLHTALAGMKPRRTGRAIFFVSFLADAYRKTRRTEEGLQALAMAKQNIMPCYKPELLRIKGELLLAREGKNQKAKGKREEISEAEGCFQKALEVARSQSAKSLELRAVMSLSRLWQRQGKQKDARQLLAEIYGWFTEGFDTADLREAKTLLEELS